MSDAKANVNRNGSLTMSKTTIVGDVKMEYTVTIYPGSDEDFDRWIPNDIVELGHRSIERLMKVDDDESLNAVDDLDPMFDEVKEAEAHEIMPPRMWHSLNELIQTYAAGHAPQAEEGFVNSYWEGMTNAIAMWISDRFPADQIIRASDDAEGQIFLAGVTTREQAEAIARRNFISTRQQRQKELDQAIDSRDRLWIRAIGDCVPSSDLMRICRRVGEEMT